MTSDHTRMLVQAASRARAHPAYLGWVLRRYVELENISEHSLAELLEVPVLDLPRLELCLRPRLDYFVDDIRQISAKFNADATALAKVVRLVESVETIAAAQLGESLTESGLLMAARARKKQRVRQSKKTHDDDQSKS